MSKKEKSELRQFLDEMCKDGKKAGNRVKETRKCMRENDKRVLKEKSKQVMNNVLDGAKDKTTWEFCKDSWNFCTSMPKTIFSWFLSIARPVCIIILIFNMLQFGGCVKDFVVDFDAYVQSKNTVTNEPDPVIAGVKTSGKLGEDSISKAEKDLESIIQHSKGRADIRVAKAKLDDIKHEYNFDATVDGKQKKMIFEKSGSATADLFFSISEAKKKLSEDGNKILMYSRRLKAKEEDTHLDETKPVTILKHPEPTFIGKTEAQIAQEQINGKVYKSFWHKIWTEKVVNVYKRATSDYRENVNERDILAHDPLWRRDFPKTAAALINEKLLSRSLFATSYEELAKKVIEENVYGSLSEIDPVLIDKGADEESIVEMTLPGLTTPVEVIFLDDAEFDKIAE